MPIDLTKNYLHIRVAKPIKGAQYFTRTKKDGRTKIRMMKAPKRVNRAQKWIAQSYLFPREDVANRREETMQEIGALSYSMNDKDIEALDKCIEEA